MKRLGCFVLCLLSMRSMAVSFDFVPFDTFKNDAQTRKKATSEQLRWLVQVSMERDGEEYSCSGSMLNKRYLLTAYHCGVERGDVFTSGACLDKGCMGDVESLGVAEGDEDIDYAIVEVKWLSESEQKNQRFSPRIQTKQDDLVLGKDGQATELFTVGLPADKLPHAMHATGFAKKRERTRWGQDVLKYNIGTINGNSGGAVWRSSDFMLVSQTNHGPHPIHWPGWKNNDPENESSWNGGPQMDLVYAQSKILPQIFVNGVNPEVNAQGYYPEKE